jgi:hypothetical protein
MCITPSKILSASQLHLGKHANERVKLCSTWLGQGNIQPRGFRQMPREGNALMIAKSLKLRLHMKPPRYLISSSIFPTKYRTDNQVDLRYEQLNHLCHHGALPAALTLCDLNNSGRWPKTEVSAFHNTSGPQKAETKHIVEKTALDNGVRSQPLENFSVWQKLVKNCLTN